MSTIKPGDVMLTKSCRMVRVLASRDDGAVAMRDYRSRVAVRSVDTDRLSYHSEHELTLVQPPAPPQEPEPYGPFFDPCGKCVTRTHCAHHDRCLAECVPADLRASAPPAVWQPIETAPARETCWFWLEPHEDFAHAIGPFAPTRYAFVGTLRSWPSTQRATHWQPYVVPSPPTPGETR